MSKQLKIRTTVKIYNTIKNISNKKKIPFGILVNDLIIKCLDDYKILNEDLLNIRRQNLIFNGEIKRKKIQALRWSISRKASIISKYIYDNHRRFGLENSLYTIRKFMETELRQIELEIDDELYEEFDTQIFQLRLILDNDTNLRLFCEKTIKYEKEKKNKFEVV